MATLRGGVRAVCFVGIISVGVGYGIAQTAGQPEPAPGVPSPAAAQSPTPPAIPSAQPAATAGKEPTTPAKKTYIVPAGTKVLLQLKSAINTRSAKAGDGVYLISIFPVVVGNRVSFPRESTCRVSSIGSRRGGRIRKSAARHALYFHHFSERFGSGDSRGCGQCAGSEEPDCEERWGGNHRAEWREGPQRRTDSRSRPPNWSGVGTIGGAESGHPIEGGLAGLGAGLATVGVVSLFTRNADVDIHRYAGGDGAATAATTGG